MAEPAPDPQSVFPLTEEQQTEVLRAQLAEVQRQLNVLTSMQTAGVSGNRLSQLPKLQRPAVWDGSSDLRRHYILPVQGYLDHFQLTNSPQCVDYAVSFLPSRLQSLYVAYAASGAPRPQNFQEFCKLVQAWHPEADRRLKAMEELQELRQKPGRLADYTKEFNLLVLDVAEVTTDWYLRYQYVKGLTLSLQREISGKYNMDTSSLHEIVHEATAAESRQLCLHKPSSQAPTFGRTVMQRRLPADFFKPPPNAASGPTPMELNAAGGVFRGNCYKCGAQGHKSHECPVVQRPPRRPQQAAAAGPGRQGAHQQPRGKN